MVIIRLSRAGAKKRPYYHMIVTDSRNRRDCGNYIECIGQFNPVARGQETRLNINKEKFDHWVKVGAQMSDRVKSLLKEFNKMAAA